MLLRQGCVTFGGEVAMVGGELWQRNEILAVFLNFKHWRSGCGSGDRPVPLVNGFQQNSGRLRRRLRARTGQA